MNLTKRIPEDTGSAVLLKKQESPSSPTAPSNPSDAMIFAPMGMSYYILKAFKEMTAFENELNKMFNEMATEFAELQKQIVKTYIDTSFAAANETAKATRIRQSKMRTNNSI